MSGIDVSYGTVRIIMVPIIDVGPRGRGLESHPKVLYEKADLQSAINQVVSAIDAPPYSPPPEP